MPSKVIGQWAAVAQQLRHCACRPEGQQFETQVMQVRVSSHLLPSSCQPTSKNLAWPCTEICQPCMEIVPLGGKVTVFHAFWYLVMTKKCLWTVLVFWPCNKDEHCTLSHDLQGNLWDTTLTF